MTNALFRYLSVGFLSAAILASILVPNADARRARNAVTGAAIGAGLGAIMDGGRGAAQGAAVGALVGVVQ
ncbi:hypothetical protein G5V57_26410 [Nordella sp. HKS 07]|uniref:YMGG-like glycine zipper-containing protein n=1 Tax=Nordella sp. HKS 07 TaxID=2712222 RepID=UPI0013E1331C|nr:YMGG-like glycine zipper-containing protein [Nordella sp. HKS 07]QIG50952.1 hypothetical protein G5V57_26410 [Nordella sp. HKS 07]